MSGHLIYGQGEMESRWSSEDSVMVERIHDHVLGQGGCVEDLRVLCKEVGARLSGSPEADAAILWGAKTPERPVHRRFGCNLWWCRTGNGGDAERAWIRVDGGEAEPLRISALGGSVGSDGVSEAVKVFAPVRGARDSLGEDGLDGAIAFSIVPWIR